MPIGPALDIAPHKSFFRGIVRASQIPAPWTQIWDDGGAATLDNANIVDPDAQILDAAKHVMRIGSVGSRVRLRLRYDDAILTFSTSPVVVVFGRRGNDPWQRLPDLCGNTKITIDHDKAGTNETVTDVTDATFMYTHPDPAKHTCDLEGCDQIVIGNEVIVASGAGDVNTVTLWIKVF